MLGLQAMVGVNLLGAAAAWRAGPFVALDALEIDVDAWAERAKLWAAGGEPDDLPHVAKDTAKDTAKAKPRDVFVYFISGAKVRNPAAAMAMIERLG